MISASEARQRTDEARRNMIAVRVEAAIARGEYDAVAPFVIPEGFAEHLRAQGYYVNGRVIRWCDRAVAGGKFTASDAVAEARERR